MKTTSQSIKLQFDENETPQLVITLLSRKQQALQEVGALKEVLAKGKILDIEIKQHRKKKSIDANSYCWVLCQKIAEVIGSTKELVYKHMIRTVGQFAIVPIREDAVETWITRWNGRGLGWHSEVMDDSKLEGYKKVISYYGSSVYLQNEMSVLINEIVNQCKELDIETATPSELKSLCEAWKGTGR